MKKVFIKHNPYKLKTEITVDGKCLADNSELREIALSSNPLDDDRRMQEWVEKLPQCLIDEYNTTDFDITFHGTSLDYEDLSDVLNDACINNGLKFNLYHEPAREVKDKEALIDEVFKKIQEGPYDELKNGSILDAFEKAKSSDFDVCVTALMSGGKSTLINSMLGIDLMPSKSEACTAIITRIKDVSQSDAQEYIPFKAKVYNTEDKLEMTYENLTYENMENINSNSNVARVEITGDIPFVSSDDISLILIDTPGPNNSRNKQHFEVQNKFLQGSAKALVIYVITGEFGTDDDKATLTRIAQSMSVGGKQSKDRFIFVVNKLDKRDHKDGELSDTLNKIKDFITENGIKNPNVFPAAALPALCIRQKQKFNKNTDYESKAVKSVLKIANRAIEDFCDDDSFHFERHAPLPLSIKNSLCETANIAYEEGREDEAALIHTGIPSVEAAIRQYVQKYAKTAKIKSIADAFMHKLEEVGCFEETKRELAKNIEESEKIVKIIDSIREKIDSAEEAKQFKDEVNEAVIKVNENSLPVVGRIVQKFQSHINNQISAIGNKEYTVDDAEYEVEYLKKFADKLEPDFKTELDELIVNNLIHTSNILIEEYQKKLSSLAEEININDIVGVKINPLKLMSGSFDHSEFSIKKYEKEKKVEDGEEYVENTDKKWYKPWTWLQEKGYYRTKYKNVKYISADEIAQSMLSPVKKYIMENGDRAIKYAIESAKEIEDNFNLKFDELDKILKSKLDELESYATNKEKADERIKNSESKLKWLEQIKIQIEKILEI